MLACAHWRIEAFPQCWDLAAHTGIHRLQEHIPLVVAAEDGPVEDSHSTHGAFHLVPYGRPHVSLVVLLLLLRLQLPDVGVAFLLQPSGLARPPSYVVSILYESL